MKEYLFAVPGTILVSLVAANDREARRVLAQARRRVHRADFPLFITSGCGPEEGGFDGLECRVWADRGPARIETVEDLPSVPA